jgi:hypothetical protein
MQLLFIDNRQLDQHAGIHAVALGMFLVVSTQVGHLLAVDQVDNLALAD